MANDLLRQYDGLGGKCDNEHPRCSNCRLYNVDCVFGQDKRKNPLAAKGRRNSLAKQSPSPHQPRPNGTSPKAHEGTSKAAKIHTTSGPLESNFSGSTQLTPPGTLSSFDDLSSGVSTGHPSFASGVEEEQSRFGFSNVDDSDTTSFKPTDADYNFTISGDPDLDYWVRSAEGPDHPLWGESIANSAQASFEDGLDQSVDWPLEDVLWSGPSPVGTSTISAERGGPMSTALGSNTSIAHKSSGGTSHSADIDELKNPEDEVTRQLSSRLGRLQIAEDGQLRYFGATSNLHILHNGPNSLSQPYIRTTELHGKNAIAQANLEWLGDRDYEELLVELFFAWHNPFMNVVDKSCYYQARQLYAAGNSTPFYSLCLYNAILAVGAAYGSHTPASLPENPSEFFAQRAKIYLDIEMDSPVVATIQALMVLSSHEAAQMRDSRGWMYAGMAVQLSSDLGLHLDLEDSRRAIESSSSNLDLIQVRKNLFWTVNTLDRLWSSFCGRPSLMKNIEYSVSSPSVRTYNWKYVAETSQMTLPLQAEFHVAGRVHTHLSELAVKMGKISDMLYSGVPDASEKAYSFVHHMAIELQQWKESLPQSVRLHKDILQSCIYVPAVFELHLQYEEAIILLFRPFISPSDVRMSCKSPELSPTVAKRNCFRAASNICNILTVYRRHYGLKRAHLQMVHVVMTAALIHTYFCSVVSGQDGKDAQEFLLTCLQALGEMGQTYRSASRALEVITSLRSNWRNESILGTGAKRRRVTESRNGESIR